MNIKKKSLISIYVSGKKAPVWLFLITTIIWPAIVIIAGVGANFLPTETIEMYSHIAPWVFGSCVVFSIALLIALATSVYIGLNSQLRRYEITQNTIDKLITSKTTSIEFVNPDMRDDIKFQGERIRKYYETTTEFIKKANKSLIIFDYLGYHDTFNIVMQKLKQSKDSEHNKLHASIEKSCTEYYETINSHFDPTAPKEKQLKYTRVLMLPMSFPEFDIERGQSRKIKDYLNQITLTHVTELYKKRKDYSFSRHIHLKITPFALTNFSFGIIDSRKLLLEIDTYNILGRCLPSHLFIIHDDENGNIVSPFKGHFESFYDKAEDLSDLKMLEMTIKEFTDKVSEDKKDRLEESRKHYRS